MLFDPAQRPQRSRVHGGRKILLELRRLLKKVRDAYHARARDQADRDLYCRTADRLDVVIADFEARDFPVDPRETRRVRKRGA